jgi:hypothetical protein
MLHEFIEVHREEIIRRCRAKVAARSVPPPTEAEIDHGVPVFLRQLQDQLRLGLTSTPEISRTAILHGRDLLLQGFTVSQVVHDYGDVCQAITDLAVELDAPISSEDFRTLNRCLDDAIAGRSPNSAASRIRPPSMPRSRVPDTWPTKHEIWSTRLSWRSRFSRRGTSESQGAPGASSSAA